MIDEKISKSIYDFTINDPTIAGKMIVGKYTPGNLTFETSDYNKFIKNDIKNYKISFNAIETITKDLVSEKSYDMEIPSFFLNQEYVIIYIFKMNNKTYKKKYSKLIKDNKEYYVIIETPNSMKFN